MVHKHATKEYYRKQAIVQRKIQRKHKKDDTETALTARCMPRLSPVVSDLSLSDLGFNLVMATPNAAMFERGHPVKKGGGDIVFVILWVTRHKEPRLKKVTISYDYDPTTQTHEKVELPDRGAMMLKLLDLGVTEAKGFARAYKLAALEL